MKNRRGRYIAFFAAGSALLLVLGAVDILCGNIGLRTVLDGKMAGDILVGIRLPRALGAVISGAALALSGAQMQAVFRNPLADPHIMGVSAGAGTGAAIATIALPKIARNAGGMTVAAAAFAGALLASLLIMAVSSRTRKGTTLLLFGVMLGFIFSAVTSIVEFSANEESLKLFYSWSAGSFSRNGRSDLVIMAGAALTGLIFALLNCKGLDIILFGDDYAEASGADLRRIRLVSMLSCCIATGAVTAFCGPIGFAGIIAPHISRWLTGSSVHRRLIPSCMLTGAVICLAADILSHAGGLVLPAGSMVAILGIPVIFVILLK